MARRYHPNKVLKMLKVNPRKMETGQSLLELAVSMVVLLVLLAGVIDIGRMAFHYISLRDAAQEGVVFGSIYPTHCDQIIDRVRANLADPTNVKITVLFDGVPCIEVTATYTECDSNEIEVTATDPDFPLTMPFLGTFIGSQSISLSAEASGSMLRPICIGEN